MTWSEGSLWTLLPCRHAKQGAPKTNSAFPTLIMLWNENVPYRPATDISCMKMALHPADNEFPTCFSRRGSRLCRTAFHSETSSKSRSMMTPDQGDAQVPDRLYYEHFW